MVQFEQLKEELKQLSNEPSIDIKISPLAAWCLITQIQLALRFPNNVDSPAQHARDIANAIQSRIPMSDAMQNFINLGWSKEYDAKPEETDEEFINRVPQREIVEVHNAYALYQSESVLSEGTIMMSRPQDWGNKSKWALERFKFEWLTDDKHYINNAYCWYNPKKLRKGDVPNAFASSLTMILMPGDEKELCGNQYLELEDFWCEEWGNMPPVHEPKSSDDGDFEY